MSEVIQKLLIFFLHIFGIFIIWNNYIDMSELESAKNELIEFYNHYYYEKANQIGKVLGKRFKSKIWEFFFNSVTGGGVFITIGGFIHTNPLEWGIGLGVVALGLLFSYWFLYKPQSDVSKSHYMFGWSVPWLLDDDFWKDIPEEKWIQIIRKSIDEEKQFIESCFKRAVENNV